MFQRLRDLLSLLVVSASFVTIFVIAPIFIALTLSSIDKRAHDLILYGTAVVAVLSGFYGMTKPQLDRSEARKALGDGPGLERELEAFVQKNKWKSETALAFCLFLLFLFFALRALEDG
jgi:hypothetical protein